MTTNRISKHDSRSLPRVDGPDNHRLCQFAFLGGSGTLLSVSSLVGPIRPSCLLLSTIPSIYHKHQSTTIATVRICLYMKTLKQWTSKWKKKGKEKTVLENWYLSGTRLYFIDYKKL